MSNQGYYQDPQQPQQAYVLPSSSTAVCPCRSRQPRISTVLTTEQIRPASRPIRPTTRTIWRIPSPRPGMLWSPQCALPDPVTHRPHVDAIPAGSTSASCCAEERPRLLNRLVGAFSFIPIFVATKTICWVLTQLHSLATLCCCFVCEEGCECCADCCECAEDCC